MQLIINGEAREFAGEMTLSALVEQLGMTAGRVGDGLEQLGGEADFGE